MIQSPEVLSRLDALAAKLNVTASHLWGVLVKQAYVEFATTMLFVVIVVVAAYAYKRGYDHMKPKADRDGYARDWDEGPLAFVALAGLALFVGGIIAAVAVTTTIGGVINPEYFALTQILSALK